LILVVGDGIRSEAAQLASLLQGNPAFNFTFALVEMSIFKLNGDGGLILCPRILVQTEMIQRAVVVINDQRVSVQLPTTAQAKPPAVTENITAAQFYDAMAKLDPRLPDKLRAFIGRLESLGVYADFQKSLNFRWDPPEGRTISLGYITPNGDVWTDTANYRVPGDLGHIYNEDLATSWGGQIRKPPSGAWSVQLAGHAPRIDQIADKLESWAGAIERNLDRLRKLPNEAQ
jgi:hypothetical protein